MLNVLASSDYAVVGASDSYQSFEYDIDKLNHIGNKGAGMLSESLKINTTLTKLELLGKKLK